MRLVGTCVFLSVFFTFCSKNGSSSANPNAGLLKSIVSITHDQNGNGHLVHKYFFTYDAQKRLSVFVDSSAISNSYAIFTFTYSGDKAVPGSYTLLYNSISGTPATELHILTSNSQNQILQDSMVPNNNASGSPNYIYSYNSGLVTRISGNFNTSLQAFLVSGSDSLFIDGNDNLVQSVYGLNPNSIYGLPGYSRFVRTVYTYDNVSSPFYNAPASLISLIRGGIASRNCPKSLEEYIDSSLVSNYKYTYQNNTDANGVLQNTISNTGDTTLCTYY